MPRATQLQVSSTLAHSRVRTEGTSVALVLTPGCSVRSAALPSPAAPRRPQVSTLRPGHLHPPAASLLARPLPAGPTPPCAQSRTSRTAPLPLQRPPSQQATLRLGCVGGPRSLPRGRPMPPPLPVPGPVAPGVELSLPALLEEASSRTPECCPSGGHSPASASRGVCTGRHRGVREAQERPSRRGGRREEGGGACAGAQSHGPPLT